MKKTREYQAAQILKKQLLNKFLWLSRVNTIVKWTIMTLLTGAIIYFSLVNSGAIMDKSKNDGVSDWQQVLFAKDAFYWPLIVTFIYMLAVFIESILSWEARTRQKRGLNSAGFSNMDLIVKRTFIRIIVHVLTIVVVAILFGWWFHIINGVYPNTGNIFFDSGLASANPKIGNISSYPIRVFAALFVSMTVILLSISILYIVVATILLLKSRKNIIMYNQIKGVAIDSLLVQKK